MSTILKAMLAALEGGLLNKEGFFFLSRGEWERFKSSSKRVKCAGTFKASHISDNASYSFDRY